jgi:hypothetical protein
MRKLALLFFVSSIVILALQTKRAYADACSCPWQVRQLTSTSSDCTLATRNAQQNAGSWASFACGSQPPGQGVCTYVWTDLGCSVDSNGTATDTSLINFKCNLCP